MSCADHHFEGDGSGASFVHDVLRHLLDPEFFVGDSPVKALDFTMNLEWLNVGNGKSECGDQDRKDWALMQELVPRVEGQGSEDCWPEDLALRSFNADEFEAVGLKVMLRAKAVALGVLDDEEEVVDAEAE